MAIGLGSILGGIGAISGILGQHRAQRDASNARNQMTAASSAAAEEERAIAAMLMEKYNQRNKIAQDAITSGVYDANRLVSRLDLTLPATRRGCLTMRRARSARWATDRATRNRAPVSKRRCNKV